MEEHASNRWTDYSLVCIIRRIVKEIPTVIAAGLIAAKQKKLQLLLMLMMGQPVLLLDEPFAGLDSKSIEVVWELIDASRQVWPQTLIIISHQLAGLANHIDYRLHLADHHLTYQGEVHHES